VEASARNAPAAASPLDRAGVQRWVEGRQERLEGAANGTFWRRKEIRKVLGPGR